MERDEKKIYNINKHHKLVSVWQQCSSLSGIFTTLSLPLVDFLLSCRAISYYLASHNDTHFSTQWQVHLFVLELGGTSLIIVKDVPCPLRRIYMSGEAAPMEGVEETHGVEEEVVVENSIKRPRVRPETEDDDDEGQLGSRGYRKYQGDAWKKREEVELYPDWMQQTGAQLISQGAEARVYTCTFLGRPSVAKIRFTKDYRLPALDYKLTKQRNLQECRSLMRCQKAGIDVPCLYFADMGASRLFMERVPGPTVKERIRELSSATVQEGGEGHQELVAIARGIGGVVGRLHKADMVHGDLTTSNFILRNGAAKSTVLIDFGLSYVTNLPEDKAVDLYVLERAFLSTHPDSEAIFEEVLKAYSEVEVKGGQATLKRLEVVRQRGRKKLCFG